MADRAPAWAEQALAALVPDGPKKVRLVTGPPPMAVQRRRAATRNALAKILGPAIDVTDEMVDAFIAEQDAEHALEGRVS